MALRTRIADARYDLEYKGKLRGAQSRGHLRNGRNEHFGERGLLYKLEDYDYSSAIDYAVQKGLLEDVVVFRMFGI
jgi:hypothetical protein